MRKSERLRILELQVARMEIVIDMLQAAVAGSLDSNGLNINDLESGKWYNARLNKDKPE